MFIHGLQGESIREIANDGESDEAESRIERHKVSRRVFRPEELRSNDACKVTEAVDSEDQRTLAGLCGGTIYQLKRP